jgi:hypothetical protein
VVDKAANGKSFLSQQFGSPLSVLFHQCYIIIFIRKLLLSEGQEGEAWKKLRKSNILPEMGSTEKRPLGRTGRRWEDGEWGLTKSAGTAWTRLIWLRSRKSGCLL